MPAYNPVMNTPKKSVHVATTRRQYKDKVYEAHLLRHSYREGGKVKTETLANLTHLGPHLINVIRQSLAGRPVGVLDEQFEIIQSWHHGHVRLVLAAMQRLGIAPLLAAKASPERSLAMAMIAARVLAPASKLSTSSWFSDTTLLAELGIDSASEDDLYAAMDWLVDQQSAVEKRLAKRHLKEGGLVLYDLSSTYFEGKTCPLAAYGYNRDGKKGKLQLNFGMVTDPWGRPVAVDVVKGNVGDPKTVMPQVMRVKDRFGIEQFVIVGDRGMLSQRHLDTLRADHPGVEWVTALRTERIRELVADKSIQPELFDERNLFELNHANFPGERLVACRNPALGRLRAQTRQSLLEATEKDLAKVAAGAGRGRLKTAAAIGLRVGRILNKHKVAKHFDLTIGEGTLQFERRQAAINAEAALDGIYVVRTSLPAAQRSTDDTVRDYKRLTQVEHAFRSMKTVDLHVRPLWHRTEKRVKAHIFLCMLAYYVQWHLEKALAPLTFGDETPEDRLTRDAVAPARPNDEVKRKCSTKQNISGDPVMRLTRVLGHMATIVRNRCRAKGGDETFDLDTLPNPLQRRALELVEEMVV